MSRRVAKLPVVASVPPVEASPKVRSPVPSTLAAATLTVLPSITVVPPE